jgi:adenylyltransferase/sulfurtransferase
MAIVIQIPTALRSFTGRQSEVPVEAATVKEAVEALAAQHPDIKPHLYKDGGEELRSFINVFVGEINIKKLDGLATRLAPNDTIMLVPAIAGGAGGL